MASWNGSILTLNNDNLGTLPVAGTHPKYQMSGFSAVSNGLGTIATSGKSYVVTGWYLSADTTGNALYRLALSYTTANDGENPTHLALGHVGEGNLVKWGWSSPPGTYICFPTGKAFAICSTIAVNLSGFIQLRLV